MISQSLRSPRSVAEGCARRSRGLLRYFHATRQEAKTIVVAALFAYATGQLNDIRLPSHLHSSQRSRDDASKATTNTCVAWLRALARGPGCDDGLCIIVKRAFGCACARACKKTHQFEGNCS